MSRGVGWGGVGRGGGEGGERRKEGGEGRGGEEKDSKCSKQFSDIIPLSLTLTQYL